MSAENALVLVNLGTPASPATRDVRRFLKVFLSDPRVVNLPRWLWLPILYGVILPFRSAKVARLYQQIWWPTGSPLHVITQQQTNKLASLLAREKSHSPVRYAMVYGEPSLATVIGELKQNGVKHVTVLPLYPQYCTATTGSVRDQLDGLQQRFCADITITMVKEYYDDELYITALAESVQSHRQQNNRGEFLLFSFHGVPQSLIDQGDPYYQQCHATAAQVALRLHLSPERWQVAFQSRFGKAEWAKPYTDLVIRELAQKGIRHLDVITPAFASDCLETLEEIAVQDAKLFQQAGGEQLTLIPCLNDSDAHIAMMKKLFEKNISQ
jgi:protoporphyrin/coproporphyrin ferrochelatase